jgi:hypothetical protein
VSVPRFKSTAGILPTVLLFRKKPKSRWDAAATETIVPSH